MAADPANLTTLGTLGAVLVASLAGSGHCAGMCGGVMAFAVGVGEERPRGKAAAHAAYHGARVAVYSALGAGAGAMGAAIDLGGGAVGGARLASWIAGGLMIVWGLGSIARSRGWVTARFRAPRRWQNVIERGYRFAFGLGPVGRAALIGSLTPMLPCGWLYLFAIVAAGTGSSAMGAVVMFVFALGTLPVMGALGAGLGALAGPLRARVPALTAGIVMASGVATVAGRTTLPSFADESMLDAAPASASAALEAASRREAPCCVGVGGGVGEDGGGEG